MNPARSEPLDYINFLVSAQKSFTCAEAARCQPGGPEAPAHDAFTPLLRRQPPDTEALRRETQGLVQLERGVLVRECGWVWLTQFRCNRRVNTDGQGNVRVDAVEIPLEGLEAHLRGCG